VAGETLALAISRASAALLAIMARRRIVANKVKEMSFFIISRLFNN
jgi:hypothetical protein